MNLGDTVSYIRHNKDGISEGAARLKGMGFDAEGRAIALLKDAEGNSFNTFLACLNRDKKFHDTFRKKITAIENLSKEGNEKAKVVVAEYNGLTTDIYDGLVGKPIEI